MLKCKKSLSFLVSKERYLLLKSKTRRYIIKLVKERNEKIKTPMIIKSTKLQLKSLIYILDKKGIVSKISV